MKIIFLSTAEIAVETLYNLLKFHDLAAVVTQPDAPKGRSKKLEPSIIAEVAAQENILLFKPEKLDNDLIEELKKLNADIFVTFAYGVILRENFFSITKYGGINIHPSLLPLLRGPSPIQSAIMSGMSVSGITIQKVALKVDSGDILYQENFDILPEDDAITLEKKVSSLAGKAIIKVLSDFENNKLNPIKQNNKEATYCKLLKKEDGLINWNNDADTIINKIRACVKWPVAYTFIDNKRINIYKATICEDFLFEPYRDFENGKIVFTDKKHGLIVKTLDSLVRIELLQLSGKKIIGSKEFLNGYRNLEEKKFLME